jgi:hypothetical protein
VAPCWAGNLWPSYYPLGYPIPYALARTGVHRHIEGDENVIGGVVTGQFGRLLFVFTDAILYHKSSEKEEEIKLNSRGAADDAWVHKR